MNSECLRIADQLERAFTGDAWHGLPLRELLADIKSDQASARPLPSAHSIWELVEHIDLYVNATVEAIEGKPMPQWYASGQDWRPIVNHSAESWAEALDRLFRNAMQLVRVIQASDDTNLQNKVPGRDYDFYYLFHGVIQHSLYHGGQIAILKKALAS